MWYFTFDPLILLKVTLSLSHSLTLTLSHSFTLSFTHFWHAEQLFMSMLRSHSLTFSLSLTLSLFHSLIHSLSTWWTNFVSMSMLRRQKSHIFSLSHSHTFSFTHSRHAEQLLFSYLCSKSRFISENDSAFLTSSASPVPVTLEFIKLRWFTAKNVWKSVRLSGCQNNFWQRQFPFCGSDTHLWCGAGHTFIDKAQFLHSHTSSQKFETHLDSCKWPRISETTFQESRYLRLPFRSPDIRDYLSGVRISEIPYKSPNCALSIKVHPALHVRDSSWKI